MARIFTLIMMACMLAAPALAQMKRAPFVMASAPSHNFAIAPRWQSTIPQAALKTCVTRATLGSTVIASGTISGWHTGLSARNDMVVAADSQGNWGLYISPAAQAAPDNCLYKVIEGTSLKWQDLPNIKRGGARVTQALNSTDGLGEYTKDQCSLHNQQLQLEARSVQTSKMLFPEKCRKYYDLKKEADRLPLARKPVMNGYGHSVDGGPRRLFTFFVSHSGGMTLYETDSSRASIKLLSGSFKYNDTIARDFAERRAGIEKSAEQARIAKQARDAAAQERALAAAAQRTAEKQAAAERLAAYEAELAKLGLVDVRLGSIRMGITPIGEARNLFASYIKIRPEELQRSAPAGKLVRYCGGGSCIYESDGKIVALTMFFFSRDMYGLDTQFWDNFNYLKSQKFDLVREEAGPNAAVYRKKKYILTSTQQMGYTREEQYVPGIGRGVDKIYDESFRATLCLFPDDLAGQLTPQDMCTQY